MKRLFRKDRGKEEPKSERRCRECGSNLQGAQRKLLCVNPACRAVFDVQGKLIGRWRPREAPKAATA